MASLIARRRCITKLLKPYCSSSHACLFSHTSRNPDRELGDQKPTAPSSASKPGAAFDPIRSCLNFGGGFDRGHGTTMKARSGSESDPDEHNKMIKGKKDTARFLATCLLQMSLAELAGLTWDSCFSPGSVPAGATVDLCFWLGISAAFASAMKRKLSSRSFGNKMDLLGLHFVTLCFVTALIVARLRSPLCLSVDAMIIRVPVFLVSLVLFY